MWEGRTSSEDSEGADVQNRDAIRFSDRKRGRFEDHRKREGGGHCLEMLESITNAGHSRGHTVKGWLFLGQCTLASEP